MVLYSLNKFDILRPWTNIPWRGTFIFRIQNTFIGKQIYRKLQYKEKIFEELQSLPRLPRKMVLYSSTKFCILKPWINIPWPMRFNLGFCQTSKQICRKLQYTEKGFGRFQNLPSFPRKMVLYLPTKFRILKPSTNIQSLRRFDWGFWQTSK